MPYINKDDRPSIDEKVSVLADEITDLMIVNEDTVELSQHYRENFDDLCNILINYENDLLKYDPDNKAEELADTIYEVSKKEGEIGQWLGHLNYALTRLIQEVPEQMVQKGAWEEPFRYWIYAATVGALDSTAIKQEKNNWVNNGLVGVLIDVKDEYKRRVNTSYEAEQIEKSGDAYTTPYQTKIVDVDIGGVKGKQEVMIKK